MILKETLKKVVELQKDEIKNKEITIKREILDKLDITSSFITIISGIRRCGKSTLLRQIMEKAKNFYFINLEDQRLFDFQLNDFEKLNEVFKETYGETDLYFFDEIQNVDGWERYIRSLQDSKKRVIVTGSNASLLSKELGTKLTGRYLKKEIYPFSYKEFLSLRHLNPSPDSFDLFMKEGAFPKYLQEKKIEILQTLFRDIIYRDIIVRYQLRNEKIIEEIAVFLLSNPGKEFTYNKLAKHFDIGSANSIIDYVNYFENSYLLFTVSKFDFSLKKQMINPKKVYVIDSGLAMANSRSFSEDKGRILENTVFVHLKRDSKEIYYFKGKNECDFLIKEKERIVESIQVCYEFNENNRNRELSGLLESLDKFKLNKGMILTFNQEDNLTIDGKKIMIKPVWKWMSE